jgi:hypothetical protein
MDRHVLGRDAKIPHPSLQWRAFVHRPASGEFKAPFGDAEAGRGDPDRRLQLFRHAGQVLPCRSLGILPDAGDLPLEQRARRHEVGIESRQTLLEALRLRQRRGHEHLLDAGPGGVLYDGGRGGLPRDDREAPRYFRLSADQGIAQAQYNLGIYYANGRGVLRDACEAARLVKLAADQGHKGAQYNLGICYANGHGVPRDDHEAARYYKLAADQGHAGAHCNLAALYQVGKGGLRRNHREAARLHKLAADQGNAFAQYNLAAFYAGGYGGLPRDQSEARRLYKLTADQGLAKAQAVLKEKPGIFTRLFGGGAETTDDGPHRLEEQENRGRLLRKNAKGAGGKIKNASGRQLRESSKAAGKRSGTERGKLPSESGNGGGRRTIDSATRRLGTSAPLRPSKSSDWLRERTRSKFTQRISA